MTLPESLINNTHQIYNMCITERIVNITCIDSTLRKLYMRRLCVYRHSLAFSWFMNRLKEKNNYYIGPRLVCVCNFRSPTLFYELYHFVIGREREQGSEVLLSFRSYEREFITL